MQEHCPGYTGVAGTEPQSKTVSIAVQYLSTTGLVSLDVVASGPESLDVR